MVQDIQLYERLEAKDKDKVFDGLDVQGFTGYTMQRTPCDRVLHREPDGSGSHIDFEKTPEGGGQLTRDTLHDQSPS